MDQQGEALAREVDRSDDARVRIARQLDDLALLVDRGTGFVEDVRDVERRVTDRACEPIAHETAYRALAQVDDEPRDAALRPAGGPQVGRNGQTGGDQDDLVRHEHVRLVAAEFRDRTDPEHRAGAQTDRQRHEAAAPDGTGGDERPE